MHYLLGFRPDTRCLRRVLFGFQTALLASIFFASAQHASADVSVRVSDSVNEQPIFQAEVRIFPFARGTYTARGFTDGGGRIAFNGIRLGSYQLEVEKNGYEISRHTIEVGNGPSESVSVILRRIPVSTIKAPPPDTISAASVAIPTAAKREYEEGLTRLKDHPAESTNLFQEAIKIYPEFAEAYGMLGLAYMRQKKNADAEAALMQAIQINPRLAFPYTLLGKLYLEKKQFAQAETFLVKSVDLDPQAWDAPYELARCYFNMGDTDRALSLARRAHDSPQAASSTHLLLVDIYLRQGNNAEALRELQEFARADPNSSFAPRVKQMIERLKRPDR